MSNIDWSFISNLEGFELEGYVPVDADGGVLGNSGVTVGSGIDLGYLAPRLSSELSDELYRKVQPYLGLTGEVALNTLRGKPLLLSDADCVELNTIVSEQALAILQTKYDYKSTVAFRSLPTQFATPIMSVAFQYGDLATKCPVFWKQVCNQDWTSAIENLRNFGDAYSTRRHAEADLMSSGLT